MKNKTLLTLAAFFMASMPVISMVSAGRVICRANGTLDEYNVEVPELTKARILVGSWRIKIQDDTVDFKARWLEENVEEEIPGTKDRFKLVLTEVTAFGIDGAYCEIMGTLELYKTGWDVETGKPMFSVRTIEDALIVITPSEIWIWFWPGEPWTIRGSTISIYY